MERGILNIFLSWNEDLTRQFGVMLKINIYIYIYIFPFYEKLFNLIDSYCYL